MNHLPIPSVASRLNALAAAAVVTLAMLTGIASLAMSQSVAPQLAQAAATQQV